MYSKSQTQNLFISPLAMDILSYLQADTTLPFNFDIHTPSFTSIYNNEPSLVLPSIILQDASIFLFRLV